MSANLSRTLICQHGSHCKHVHVHRWKNSSVNFQSVSDSSVSQSWVSRRVPCPTSWLGPSPGTCSHRRDASPSSGWRCSSRTTTPFTSWWRRSTRLRRRNSWGREVMEDHVSKVSLLHYSIHSIRFTSNFTKLWIDISIRYIVLF